ITGLNVPPPAWRLPQAAFVPQATTTRLLTERATELGVDIRRGHEVTGFVQDDTGVTVQVSTPDGSRRLSTGYLLGGDGSRSMAREVAGIESTGSAATLTTLAGEVRLIDPANAPAGWVRTPRGCTVISPHPDDGLSRIVAIDFSGPNSIDRDAPVTLD